MKIKPKILCIIGTRPEAIKMAPIIRSLRAVKWGDVRIVFTGQHRHLLDQNAELFDLKPDRDLYVMTHDQSLADLTANLLSKLDQILLSEAPDAVLIQGDTTTVMSSALAAFYREIPIGHVEAGLRTFDIRQPFPEELNRAIVTKLTKWHFAPTILAKDNLLKDGVNADSIYVTGNTVIDTLIWTAKQEIEVKVPIYSNKKLILITAHRRENIGEGIESICLAIKQLSERNSDIQFLFPLHPNPNVHRAITNLLSNLENVTLCDALPYTQFVQVMKKAHLIITDSGGVQEEAPALNVPVLVTRDVTERVEATQAGCSKTIGNKTDSIVEHVQQLIDDPRAHAEMASAGSPYGDGKSAERIVEVLRNHFIP